MIIMNKFQKKRHKEVKEMSEVKNINYSLARKVWNYSRKINYFTPCENCCGDCNGRKPNKLAYCKYWD